MADRVMISWLSADGEEHDEVWATVDAFRCWAEGEGLRCAYRAYVEDEDGDWVEVERGRVR